MRYISFYRPAAGMSGRPDPEHMAEMAALGEREMKAGRLLMMGALLPAGRGLRVRRANGAVTAQEGAGPEAFGQGCGFAILQAKDEADQRAQIEEFLSIAGDGECILVPLMEGPPPQ